MADDVFGAISVMVVDDEESSRRFVEGILGMIGVGHVLFAENGAVALGRLTETTRRIDLIICDLDMPEMTGYEFVRQLRRGTVPRFKDVPVLILTGRSAEANTPQSRAHKFNGYVTKPPTIDMLKVQIGAVLGLQK